jgi:hypothetical protein
MQKVYKDTYLGPIEEHHNTPIIYDKKDIPLEITNIKEYLVTPINSKQSVFLGKIYIHTNHTLQDFQASDILTDYLKQENMIIEINDLDDVNPVQLGFIEHIMPKLETISLHQKRISNMIPPNSPKFQLQVSSLWGKSGERSKICMIKCDECNKEIMLQIFEQLNEDNTISFFPMTDFATGCTQEQKTTIIKRTNKWRAQFRSILIPGFCDDEDNVPIIYDNTNDPSNILTQTSVTEYLAHYIKNSNGDNLFTHVYPPQNGIREVIVHITNFTQASSFIKVCHGELARIMDIPAIDKVFIDPTQAYLDASKPVWKPNNRVLNVVPTYENDNKGNDCNPKRKQYDNNNNAPITRINSSYSQITAGTSMTTHTKIPVQEMDTIKQIIDESINMKLKVMQQNMSKDITDVDGKINALQNTIKSIGRTKKFDDSIPRRSRTQNR